MSNADIFSLFPAPDSPSEENADELSLIFDDPAIADDTEPAGDLDNTFELMFDEIMLERETEAIGPAEADPESLTTAMAAIEADLDSAGGVWDDEDNSLTTDLMAIEMEIDEPEALEALDELEALEELDEIEDATPVHSLVPPLLLAYQDLQSQVEQLRQQLETAERQSVAHQRRADSAEALIDQQASQLGQVQDQLTHAVAELQIHQEEAQRQKLQVETLAEELVQSQQLQVETLVEELVQSQTQLQDLAQQLKQSQAQLAIAVAEKQTLEAQIRQHPAHMGHLEKQIEDLNARLQRQQRYTMQYKFALEQCLAQPDFHPSSDISQVVARLTGQNPDFQPWASVGDILAAFPALDVPETPTTPPPAPLPSVLTSGDRRSEPASNLETTAATPQPNQDPPKRHRRAIGPDTLSFAVREPEKAPPRPVELPGFLRRPASASR